MERRKKQLELMLQEAKDKIEDHYSGRALLESEEKEKLEKRNEIIERKLERMQDLDERVSPLRCAMIQSATTR